MEPAKLVVNHIFCPLHKGDLIRRVGINSRTDLSLLCAECMEYIEEKQNQTRYILEDFMQQIVQSYAQVPKLQQLPDSANQILNTENEIVANFTFHIEKQKEQLNAMFDKLRQAVYLKLENKKRQLIANLDSQVKGFEDTLTDYKQKVFRYKAGPQEDHDKDQETALTFESLYKEVNKVTNANELKKLLMIHYENMKSNEIFAQVKGDEAKKIVADAIEVMSGDLTKLQTVKPTISFGNNVDLEELFKLWDEQVDTAINGFKIEIKDPIQPIRFELSRGWVGFDSEILKNEPANKNLIADWVNETIKADRVALNLIYRGSRDGYTAKNFHEKCDNRGPTVVIVENTIGNKFGGYAAVSWTSGNGGKFEIKNNESFSCFLFSVDKKQKLPYNPGSNHRALGHSPDYGPIFGYAAALAIADNCNANSNSYCDYSYNSYQNLKEGGHLSGTRNFTVKEIEVYAIVLK